jgi:hypothetical protein
MQQAGVHSLQAPEEFLKKDITDESSKLEKYCFSADNKA